MTLVVEAPARSRPSHAARLNCSAHALSPPHAIVHAAIASLHAELALSPKPGLVCSDDRGSHDDMDATTMMKSIVALRRGFKEMVYAAMSDAPFARLQEIGMATERAMLRATEGVNTHRGAIFNIGLLAAAIAHCMANDLAVTTANVRDTICNLWGRHIDSAPADLASHGSSVTARYGAGGARREAANGFPTVFASLWPALLDAWDRGLDQRRARVHVLMTSIATTTDTNLLYRGGTEGLAFAQRAARDFLDRGGVADAAWESELRAIGRAFVARKLSPGGSADLLAATLFVDRLVESR